MKSFQVIRRYRGVSLTLLGALGVSLGAHAGADADGSRSFVAPTYTVAQAKNGQDVYDRSCASCHGAALDDGQFGPPLKGFFLRKWAGRSVAELLTYTETEMPPGMAGSLSQQQYRDVLAYLFQRNDFAPSREPLPSTAGGLQGMYVAPPSTGGDVLGEPLELPPPRLRVNPLDRFTPVTETMLVNPPDGDWLMWRRTYDGHGFSPLRQITTKTVDRLQIAWTWSLPNAQSRAAPLVHDGVMFVLADSSHTVEAFDAASGDLLWRYVWRGDVGGPNDGRAVAVHGEKLFVPINGANEGHIVAINVKTGAVVWDQAIDKDALGVSFGEGFHVTGGPIVARGKVMFGTKNITAPGGNYVVALDVESGKPAWVVNTIARPGEVGGDSWNGIGLYARSGASVWVPGSYDPSLNLAYFGVAQTYDTALLNTLADGAVSNDALFTDSTLAITPDNGRMEWYYQHLPNDQWDLDWAFERLIIDLSTDGGADKVVVAAGKLGLFDALNAENGAYRFTRDTGLQNIIAAIDPQSGAKKLASGALPGDGNTKLLCPHPLGAKNWFPTAFDQQTGVLYAPLTEVCAEWSPVAPGERGFMTSGERLSLLPRPDGDGNFGRLQAVDLVTGQAKWMHRQRAPLTTGLLATAGGVIFAGSLDRTFAAFDAATGRELWRTRLNSIPNSPPISFMVGGKQYIAITAGNGGASFVAVARRLTPEIQNPPGGGAVLWVFALPDTPL